MLDELQQAAKKILGDFFMFRVNVPKPMKAALLGSLRFIIKAQLACKPFTGFALDIEQGNEPRGLAEWKERHTDLGFVCLKQVRLPVCPLADHFAEKLHACTHPKERRTRVKDLLNLCIILEELADRLPTSEEMQLIIKATFDCYGTHVLPDPPEDWAEPFKAEAMNLELTITDIRSAYNAPKEY